MYVVFMLSSTPCLLFGTSIPTSLKKRFGIFKITMFSSFWLSKYDYLDQGFGQLFNFFVCVWRGGAFSKECMTSLLL